MIRLHVTTEGQTEQKFVKSLLATHLGSFNVSADARCVLTSKDKLASKQYRGGMTNYRKAKNDIMCWMKQDTSRNCRFTTMFDLYALPADFPGFSDAQKEEDPYQKVDLLEKRFADDIADQRFIPYIQLHEFETLILAEPKALEVEYLAHKRGIDQLAKMVLNQNPELINGNPETAPSKRIMKEIKGYDKVLAGVSVVGNIGIEVLKQSCEHFGRWVTTLEGLAQKP